MKVKTNLPSQDNAQAKNLGVFAHWEQAKEYLSDKDPVLARLFALDPQPPQKLYGVFDAIIRAIVSQQISNKAAHRIWSKVEALVSSNRSLLSVLADSGISALSDVGLSRTKLATIEAVIQKYQSGEWSDASLCALSDAALVKTLTAVKGIGPWSANSVLIFGLGRPDVCPLDDFGIKTALKKHYLSLQMTDFGTRTELNKTVKLIVGNWAPYRTVATLVLWHSLGNAPQ